MQGWLQAYLLLQNLQAEQLVQVARSRAETSQVSLLIQFPAKLPYPHAVLACSSLPYELLVCQRNPSGLPALLCDCCKCISKIMHLAAVLQKLVPFTFPSSVRSMANKPKCRRQRIEGAPLRLSLPQIIAQNVPKFKCTEYSCYPSGRP